MGGWEYAAASITYLNEHSRVVVHRESRNHCVNELGPNAGRVIRRELRKGGPQEVHACSLRVHIFVPRLHGVDHLLSGSRVEVERVLGESELAKLFKASNHDSNSLHLRLNKAKKARCILRKSLGC